MRKNSTPKKRMLFPKYPKEQSKCNDLSEHFQRERDRCKILRICEGIRIPYLESPTFKRNKKTNCVLFSCVLIFLHVTGRLVIKYIINNSVILFIINYSQ